MKTKICTKCGIEKEINKFHPKPSGKFGVMAECKICRNIYTKKYSENHKKEKSEYMKEWFLNKRYGITKAIYNQMLEAQNYLCAICGKPETSFDKKHKTARLLSVDHNHKSGKIRALLCTRCNHTLGRINEDINLLQNIINYIIKYKD